MKKWITSVAILASLSLVAQHKSKWEDIFSYNQIIKIKQDGSQIIAATKSGLFFYDHVSGAIKKLSKVNGLHEVGISAFDYNPSTKIGLIGYETGAMDVVTPEGVFLTVDIPIAASYQGDKKINHIFIKDNQAVISTGYGVSIFNLDKREFGETAFFQSGGGFVDVKESIIKDNIVYAATKEGLKYHVMDIQFPVYSSWQSHNINNLLQADADDTQMLIASANKVYMGNNLQPLSNPFQYITDLVITDSGFLVVDLHKVYEFSSNGTLVQVQDTDSNFINTTGALQQGKVFIGTDKEGILKYNYFGGTSEQIKPDGPYNNISNKIVLLGDKIWVASGMKEADYHEPVKTNNLGFYYFDGQSWQYPDYFKTAKETFNILDIAVKPSNEEVYFTNFVRKIERGAYKFKNDVPVSIFNLGSNKWFNAPEHIIVDNKENIISTVAWNDENPEYISIYAIPSGSSSAFSTKVGPFRQHSSCILSSGNKLFIGGPRNPDGGLMIYDTKGTLSNFSDDQYVILRESEGLPTPIGVTSVALDKYNDLWIGNIYGLRVLSNATGDITNAKANPIVITQNGIPEELFKDSEVLSIAVDSGNNKWVSIKGGGVYFLSQDGQTVYQHFTKANSPLPSDEVYHIAIDDKTGKVYFATRKGIVYYKGDVSNVTENFGEVLVYPNPVVYSQYKGNVKIKGLAEKTNIRITDAAGNLVHQAVSRNGFYEWDLKNYNGSRVASGIYFVLMTNADGTDKATAKIAVVN